MKSEEILMQLGIEKDTYPADAVFDEFNLIGTYSKDCKIVCIMIEDNEDIGCSLSKEAIKEIAFTVDRLITNFGCDVHSYTMKNFFPFTTLKIDKVSNLLP